MVPLISDHDHPKLLTMIKGTEWKRIFGSRASFAAHRFVIHTSTVHAEEKKSYEFAEMSLAIWIEHFVDFSASLFAENFKQ